MPDSKSRAGNDNLLTLNMDDQTELRALLELSLRSSFIMASRALSSFNPPECMKGKKTSVIFVGYVAYFRAGEQGEEGSTQTPSIASEPIQVETSIHFWGHVGSFDTRSVDRQIRAKKLKMSLQSYLGKRR